MQRKPKLTVHERLRMAGPGDKPPTAREIARSLRTLQEARVELSPDAYITWTCLIDEEIEALSLGVTNLARRFKVDRSSLYRGLRKLKDAGYVDYDEGPPFKKTVIHLQVAMIAKGNNHIYKSGSTVFTIPTQAPAPSSTSPVLTVISRPEPSPKSATNPDPNPTNLPADGLNPPELLNTCRVAPLQHAQVPHYLNQPELEPTVQPPEIVEDKDPLWGTGANGKPGRWKNGTRQYNTPISSLFKKSDQEISLPDLPSFTPVPHRKCSVPSKCSVPPAVDAISPAVDKSVSPAVDRSVDSSAVDAIPSAGPDSAPVPLSPAAGALPLEGPPLSRTEEDRPAAEASGLVDVAKLKRRRSPAAREAAKRRSLGAVTPVPPGTKRNPLPVPAVVYGFTLKGEARKILLDRLAQGNRSKDRIAAVYALGDLARQKYAAWRRKQPGDSEFTVNFEDYEKQWKKLGVTCFQRGIQPAQVFDFWAKPENNFTRLNYPYKQIPFICGLTQIEAACDEAGTKRPLGAKAPPARVDAMHAYDPKKLHPELRQVLEDAGHDVSEKTDRHLMTTQGFARDLANGRHVHGSKILTERAKLVMHLFKENHDAD
ncbi:hypothetical protein LCGC14_0460160 [marine sediment metagenome]|uniref:Uncharacterized protein n=1 Tax=marine sediment metagenome TaxID=412755 RepID=A0A0F9V221_9ZZZZ